DERHFDPVAREYLREQRVAAPVELTAGDDPVAALREGRDERVYRRPPRGEQESRLGPLQLGDQPLERKQCGVAVPPRVRVAGSAEADRLGVVLRRFEP